MQNRGTGAARFEEAYATILDDDDAPLTLLLLDAASEDGDEVVLAPRRSGAASVPVIFFGLASALHVQTHFRDVDVAAP